MSKKTRTQLQVLLRQRVTEAGGQVLFAAQHGLSQQAVSRALKPGAQLERRPLILKALQATLIEREPLFNVEDE